MSRDFDDIYKKIDQSHKELYKRESSLNKDINDINKTQTQTTKDIGDIKKQIKDINYKIDLILEILNNFTIMLEETEEDMDYESDTTWVPEEEEEDYDDHWSDSPDES